MAAGVSSLRMRSVSVEEEDISNEYLSTNMLKGRLGIPHAELPWVPSDPGRTKVEPQARIDHRRVTDGSSTSTSILSPMRTIYLTISGAATRASKPTNSPQGAPSLAH